MSHFSIPDGLNIRPSKPSDAAFIRRLHSEVRQDLQHINADQDFIESIVDMQFKAQTEGYGEKFPNAMYFIIEKHHQPIGKVTIDFGVNEVRIIDIGFITQARGHGFGAAIIQSFQHAAADSCTPLTLTVEQSNFVAKALYLRLGFVSESVSPPYEFMIWYPAVMKKLVVNC